MRLIGSPAPTADIQLPRDVTDAESHHGHPASLRLHLCHRLDPPTPFSRRSSIFTSESLGSRPSLAYAAHLRSAELPQGQVRLYILMHTTDAVTCKPSRLQLSRKLLPQTFIAFAPIIIGLLCLLARLARETRSRNICLIRLTFKTLKWPSTLIAQSADWCGGWSS